MHPYPIDSYEIFDYLSKLTSLDIETYDIAFENEMKTKYWWKEGVCKNELEEVIKTYLDSRQNSEYKELWDELNEVTLEYLQRKLQKIYNYTNSTPAKNVKRHNGIAIRKLSMA